MDQRCGPSGFSGPFKGFMECDVVAVPVTCETKYQLASNVSTRLKKGQEHTVVNQAMVEVP